mmetsp:Transcript_975/g.3119  ORF Transcript_975/g.3119 Transcript_975/m.3119 type:complete len:239 (+) Transcript_975:1995-2711(+)
MHLSTRISASRDCDESHCRPSVVETAGACGATTGAVSSATIGAASRAGRCESPPELLVVPCRFFRPSCAARDRFSCRGGSASASSRWSSTSTSARLGCVLAASLRDGSGRAADRPGRAAGALTCCSDDCASRVSTSSSASEASGGVDLYLVGVATTTVPPNTRFKHGHITSSRRRSGRSAPAARRRAARRRAAWRPAARPPTSSSPSSVSSWPPCAIPFRRAARRAPPSTHSAGPWRR